MSILDRVNAFLTARRPSRFCDDCIAASIEFGRRDKVWLTIRALETTDSVHCALGVCSMCGKEKKVTQRA